MAGHPGHEHCACLSSPGREKNSLTRLDIIRSACPALREILLPDRVWSAVQSWHGEPDVEAAHRSILLLAVERGYLSRLTIPIHRFLLDGDAVLKTVRRQYVRDLVEGWMHREDAVERHRKSRVFRGRLAELQFAFWLEQSGWSVTGLEALREGPDVEAMSESYGATAFEVKFLGVEDSEFESILCAIAGQDSGGAVSAYSGANYLLFRIYEAAKQLEKVQSRRRVAVVVVDDLTWWRVDVQLREKWIDFAAPRFLFPNVAWNEFLGKQRDRYPDLDTDLEPAIGRLDSAWIIRQTSQFECILEYDLPMRRL